MLTVCSSLYRFPIVRFPFLKPNSALDYFKGRTSPGKAGFAEVVISEIDGKYHWASHENRELKKIVGGAPAGAIITYLALDGTGYIGIIIEPSWKKNMQARFPDYELDCTEHTLQALGSISYYGKALNR